MHMRLIKGRWYTNIRNPNDWRKKIEISLDACERETKKAQINLGMILSDLQNSIDPASARQRVDKLVLKGKVTEREEQILRSHIIPFFGEYKPRDVTKEAIESYFESRWDLSSDGELKGYRNTVSKELMVLQRLIRVSIKNYNLPKISYKKLKREILAPLTLDQIKLASNYVQEKYLSVYWIMAYTAMDVSDVVHLKPEHFKDGWIIKERGKTSNEITVPVCSSLSAILKDVPWPIQKDVALFADLKPKAVATAIRRAFVKAGMEGYGAKYLRRYVASALLDAGYSMDWIGKALAHAEGSHITKKYTKVYKKTLQEAFSGIERGKNVGT